MNLKITPLAWVAVLSLLFITCKEEELPAPDAQLSSAGEAKATVDIPPYTLYTIAGGSSLAPMFQDGEGRDAHFAGPAGLQLKNSDLIYIADKGNGKIRKVVIKPVYKPGEQYTGVVTTLNTPPGPNGLAMTDPMQVGVSDDGTINTLFTSSSSQLPGGYVIFGRIYKPDGTIYTVQTSSQYIYGMSEDPGKKFFWFTGSGGIGKFWSDHIQLPNFTIPRDSLAIRTSEGQLFTLQYPNAIYAGPNGVKYLVTQYQLFKFTKEREFTKIAPIFTPYKDPEPFPNVTSIAVTADGKTIYLASSGLLTKLENGITTVLYRPTDSSDGPGIRTEIYVSALAIDDKRHILYFTDGATNSLRMMTLPGYKGR